MWSIQPGPPEVKEIKTIRSRSEAEAHEWFNGPPYAKAESVSPNTICRAAQMSQQRESNTEIWARVNAKVAPMSDTERDAQVQEIYAMPAADAHRPRLP
jgi:hypothetical protein